MRLNEIVNLRWKNVNLATRIITVGDEDFTTKGRNQRYIPISDEVFEILEAQRKKLQGKGGGSEGSQPIILSIQNPLSVSPFQKRGEGALYVFAKLNGEPFTGDYFSKRFKRACKSAGIDKSIHFHSLRHSFASNLAQKGVSLYTIKELLGHSSITTTEIYSHLNMDALKEAIETLNGPHPKSLSLVRRGTLKDELKLIINLRTGNKMNTVKEMGLQYHQLFGFNVLPIQVKKPKIQWDKWQSEKQTDEDIEKMDWSNTTGIGVVLGNDDLRNLDLDIVEDYEILDKLICDLELPEKYNWVIQSGSGEGFHIYLRVKDDKGILSKKFGGDKAVFKFKPKEKNICKHVEVRWKNCQTVLPPSMHESGGVYTFYYDEPKELPPYIEAEELVEVISKYFEIEETAVKQINVNERKEEVTHFDKERLESALECLSKNLPSNCYEEWYRIGFALVPYGEVGRKYFVGMSLANPNYHDTEMQLNKKFDEFVKDYDGRVTLGSLFHIAENFGWVKPIVKFWYFDDRGVMKISRTRFKRLLESEGFCKYRIDGNYLFVRIRQNIVEEIDCIDVKETVMHYLESFAVEDLEGTTRTELIDILIKSAQQLFSIQFLEFLITRTIKFNKDCDKKGYFYFQNGYAEIEENRIQFKDYKTLEKHIWRKQIIKRNYVTTEKRSMFEDLLFNICRIEVRRYEALKSGIGYLLHAYKDPSNAKAVIFIDEKLSEGSFGRSGKGLVIKGISHIRNTVVEDGRNFNPSKNFAFQRVKADTSIIAIEDIGMRFPFERLFSIITDGITIERKNKDEMFLSGNESPKLVISTNYSIKGVDDSTLDRQFVIEFSDYYNKNYRPFDEFGKRFYEGWNETDWNSFDCFMIECLQLYLMRGLVAYEYVNLEKKKLIDETSIEFSEYSEGLELEKEYDKKELFEDFKKEYSDYDSDGPGKLTQRKLTHWFKMFGRIKGLNIVENKSGAKRTIVIVNPHPSPLP